MVSRIKRQKKKILITVAGLFIFLLFINFTSVGNATYKSFLILSDQIPAFPVKPLKLLTRPSTHESLEIPDGDRRLKVDLLKPAGKKKFPLVIVSTGAGIGFANSSIGDLSESLGRVGVGIAFVDIPELENLGKTGNMGLARVTPSLVNTFKYFRSQSFVTKEGFMGFCVGGTLALVASESPQINNSTSFIIAFQPSYGLGSSLLLTGYALKPDGGFRSYQPNQLTLNAIKNIYIEKLEKSDQELLVKNSIENKDIPVKDLTGDGMKVYNFLTNKDPKKFSELYNNLPEKIKENTENFNPSLKIKELKAKVFTFSSSSDSFMSVEESDLLNKDLPSSQKYYTRLESLVHIQPDEHFKFFKDMGEYAQIYGFIYSTIKFINN